MFHEEIEFHGLHEFVTCFDTACQDFARIDSKEAIQEPDFRQMVHEHDMFTKTNFGPVADKLVLTINKLVEEGNRRQDLKEAKRQDSYKKSASELLERTKSV